MNVSDKTLIKLLSQCNTNIDDGWRLVGEFAKRKQGVSKAELDDVIRMHFIRSSLMNKVNKDAFKDAFKDVVNKDAFNRCI